MSVPLGGAEPLIDVHAHFFPSWAARHDWAHLNARRLSAGDQIGITYHVASVLGSWGATSPTYFQSPTDTRAGNDAMFAVAQAHANVRAYVAVNPNEGEESLAEVRRGAAAGAVGLKLAAARRCDDPLLDPLIACAEEYGFPVLHHIWQHRRRHWPSQDISDGADLARLARRHPRVSFILAHIGGGGDYSHTFAAVADRENILLDLSGSGVDRGMLDAAYRAVGARRMLWGADITLCTGLAKLWALDHIGLSAAELQQVRWVNAVRIFPSGTFGKLGAAAGGPPPLST